LKIATWNVNSLRVRLPHLLDWLGDALARRVCLQETKCEDATFPAAELAAAGYCSLHHGQRTYNGVAILTRTRRRRLPRHSRVRRRAEPRDRRG
jgi:exodeoxyribonuclease-3